MDLAVPGLDTLALAGQRVLVRVDFNVPLDEAGEITDDTRIRAALPTLLRILADGGKPVLLSHLGRPKGQVKEALRLDPVAARLGKLLGSPVVKLDESIGDEVAERIERAPTGTTVLLENVRFHAGEEQGDPELAAAFARLGDVFVNDAFGTCHRAHASVSGIAGLLPSAAGLLLLAEIKAFERVLDDPARPLVAVLGGAKVSDKLKVIDHLLERVQAIVVGGGMAYTFLQARGVPIGNSLVQADQVEACAASLAKAAKLGVDLLLPEDHIIAERFSAEAPARVAGGAIPPGWMGLDIGPRTIRRFTAAVAEAQTLVWNGPMGVFEMEPFRAGTEALGRAVAECQGYTVVGGGDSVAAIELFGLADRIDHVSTGGGASLELLEGRALPGIVALQAEQD